MKSHVTNWIDRYRGSWSLASDAVRMVLASIIATLLQMVLVYLLVTTTGWLPESVTHLPADLFTWYFLFCLTYVVLCHMTFGKLNPEQLRSSLTDTKPAQRSPLMAFIYGESGTSHATLFSLLALIGVGLVAFGPADVGGDANEAITHATALLTVIGSWMSNVASFALQYARDDAESDQRGFRFPDDINPDWSDYTYAAVMVSTSLTTADIAIVSRSRRRLVVINSVIAFTFNTVIIAMLIAAIM